MTRTAIDNGRSPAVDKVLSSLANVSETGAGQWDARCPAHEDNRNSLCIGAGDDGRALMHCQAGCATVDVVAAVGLTMADLMGPSTNGNGRARSEIIVAYDYRDESGKLLFQVVRFEPKQFRQRRPKEGGGWHWSVNGVQQVPYHLPELLASDASQTVFVVEGEKDVHALERLGIVSTCNAGGAGKWKHTYVEHFKGRLIAILSDNDDAGRKHAAQVAWSLHSAAESVKVISLPGLLDKGDVSDWLDAGGDADILTELVKDVSEWEPAAPVPVADNEPPRRFHLTDLGNADRFANQHGDTVRFCHVWNKWLIWDGRRWAIDTTGKVDRLAKATILSIYRAAANEPDQYQRDALSKWAVQSERAERIAAMIKLARSEQGIAINSDGLDADLWDLNCENGVLDLKTGKLRPHDPRDLITKLCPVVFDPDADCKLWLRTLDRCMSGDIDRMRFLRRAAGMSATGIIEDHVLLVCYGTGSNGKSVILNAMRDTIGPDYAISAATSLLMAQRGGGSTNRLLRR